MRKKLLEVGIEIKEQVGDDYKALKRKIQVMRERGLSYQQIADTFNLWKISTRTGDGQWYSKSIRDIVMD